MLALIVAGLPAASALAHGGNPNFRSEFRAVRPAVPGLQVQVLNYDDRLLLINRTGKTVLVRGYEREPYARLRADGAVEVNKRSPSYYLNEERYGGTPVPPSASPKAPPQWSLVSKTGRFETHDHRIHWMSKGATPPQVTDKDKRTKVFDWRVPIEVGSRACGPDGIAVLGAELRRGRAGGRDRGAGRAGPRDRCIVRGDKTHAGSPSGEELRA